MCYRHSGTDSFSTDGDAFPADGDFCLRRLIRFFGVGVEGYHLPVGMWHATSAEHVGN